jgi:hypothetical protein
LLALQAVSLVAVAAAGRITAGRAEPGGQAAWLGVAIAVLIVASAGNGLWLAAVRRATGVRHERLVARLEADAVAVAAGVARADASEAAGLVTVPGLTLSHRPGCALVAGKAVGPASAGQRRCGWCQP